MKKIAALLVTIVFAAVAVFLMPRLREEFSPEPLAPSSPPMRLARYYWPGQFWKEIAQDRGWFAEAGLAVELVDTNPDYYASLDAMVAGALDENDFTLFDAVHYQAKGADLVIILNTANSTGVDGIVGRRELKGIDDLRGRTIGVSRNTYLQYLLQEVLLRHRLSLEDVRLQDMPTEKAVVAFAEGSLDAVVAWEPLLGKAAAQGNGHLLFNTSKMVNSLPGVSVVRRQFVEERPADIQRFVTVWKRTVSYMEENPDEAFGIIAQRYGVPLSEVLALVKANRIAGVKENRIAFTYASGRSSLHGLVLRLASYQLQHKLIEVPVDVFSLIEPRFFQEVTR